MAVNQESQFLKLPLELRLKIYEELLCPQPGRPLQIYHDRIGRKCPINTHPAILRTNKKIYEEAVDLLYEHNIFEIRLATMFSRQWIAGYQPDSMPDAPPLIRRDAASGSSLEMEGQESSAVHPVEKTKHMEKYTVIPAEPGIICPESLQRMSHVRLLISGGALWGQTMGGNFRRDIAPIVLDILKCLENGSLKTPRKKVLDIVLVLPGNISGIFMTKRYKHEDTTTLDLAAQLVALKRVRTVRVRSQVRWETPKKVKTTELDFEGFIGKVQELKSERMDERPGHIYRYFSRPL